MSVAVTLITLISIQLFHAGVKFAGSISQPTGCHPDDICGVGLVADAVDQVIVQVNVAQICI